MTATRKLLEQAKIKAADFEMPVDRLIRRLNDANLSEEYRDKLAAIVAPYTAPRLNAVSISKRPSQMERGRTQATTRTLKRIAEATGHALVVDFQPLKTV